MTEKIDKNSPIDNSVSQLATSFDKHFEAKDINSILQTMNKAQSLSIKEMNECSQAQLYYSIATSYSDLLSLGHKSSSADCVEESIGNQLFFFRKSINIIENYSPSRSEKPYISGIARQLYTNYGNLLHTVGRPIEALQFYQKALIYDSKFAMAQGNMGITYYHYAETVSDSSHQELLLYFSYHYLKKALSNKKALPNYAKVGFKKYFLRFSNEFKESFLEKELELKEYSLGNKQEQEYRKWCLSNRFFLNPMNDLPFAESFIAADVNHLPNIINKVSDGLDYKLHGMFNQIKQEFIAARFLFYEGQQVGNSIHFADKDTHLLNSPDYPVYSIRVEKIKLSFRSLFSLFDKIAFFINEYFELGIPERRVYFKCLWNEEKAKALVSSNRIFKGIYWISKEFHLRRFNKFINPQAKRINEIRNSLEHKYTKVVQYDNINSEHDSLADYLTYEELIAMTSYLMRIVREAILYLSLSININEQQLHSEKKDKFIPPIILWPYDDEWKL